MAVVEVSQEAMSLEDIIQQESKLQRPVKLRIPEGKKGGYTTLKVVDPDSYDINRYGKKGIDKSLYDLVKNQQAVIASPEYRFMLDYLRKTTNPAALPVNPDNPAKVYLAVPESGDLVDVPYIMAQTELITVKKEDDSYVLDDISLILNSKDYKKRISEMVKEYGVSEKAAMWYANAHERVHHLQEKDRFGTVQAIEQNVDEVIAPMAAAALLAINDGTVTAGLDTEMLVDVIRMANTHFLKYGGMIDGDGRMAGVSGNLIDPKIPEKYAGKIRMSLQDDSRRMLEQYVAISREGMAESMRERPGQTN